MNVLNDQFKDLIVLYGSTIVFVIRVITVRYSAHIRHSINNDNAKLHQIKNS